MAKKEADIRFSKFGTVSFTSVTRVNDFIDYLEQGKLMGTRCKTSGKQYFPPRAHCQESLDSNMEWFEVTGSGKLAGFSTLRYAPAGFKEDLPYTLALLDFDDFRVFGRIAPSIPEADIVVGMEMVVEVTKTGSHQLTYQFLKA
jgi:uncharacterized protein